MTNVKTTKRALISSVVALLVCFSMLIGTTYAWFTDSVTSAGNIIKTGNLDVEMYWADGTKAVPSDENGWTDASTGAIFDYDNWEPGYVQVRHIKIANEGTLALKYKVNIVANGEVSDLADVIDVYYVDPAVQVADRAALTEANKLGTLTDALKNLGDTGNGTLEAGNADTITIALKMQESAGNNYMNKSIGADFSIQLLATQLASENDSFGNDYDKDATYPGEVKTVEQLVNAVKAGESVKLVEDLVVEKGTNLTFEEDAKIDLAGNDLVISKGASLTTKSGELNIVNSSDEPASIDLTGATVKAEGANAVINIENVEITMGTNITNDRIQVLNGATVNMNGGKLVSAGRPCVYLDGGTFNMNGGEIVVPANKSGITCGTSGTNAINLNGGKITVASGAIGINTMNLGSIYISNGFVFELADATAYSLLIVDSQAPTITGTEPENVKHS